jgi:anti-sigma factor RsiW
LLFEGLLDGALTSRTQAALCAHLDRCTDCQGLLEELRVVDALLLRTSVFELSENFTTQTMAAMEQLPTPRPAQRALWSLLGAYLATAWLMIALALVFDGAQARAILGGAFSIAGGEIAALGSLAHGLLHTFDSSLSSLTAVSIGALVLDMIVGVALVVGYRAMRRSEVVR